MGEKEDVIALPPKSNICAKDLYTIFHSPEICRTGKQVRGISDPVYKYSVILDFISIDGNMVLLYKNNKNVEP